MTLTDELLALRPASVGAMFRRRVDLTPHEEAFRYPDANENWISLTWTQTEELVNQVAAGLLALGLQNEQRVAIAANTRIEWILADFGINLAGGATTTIYPNTQADDVDYILLDSGSVIVIAENDEQVAKVSVSRELDAQVHHIIVMDGTPDNGRVITWSELLRRGASLLQDDPTVVARATAATNNDSLATLIYTSGTTGRPKGVELTHGNWTYEGVAIDRMEIIDQYELQYLWLPLSHVFGKLLLAAQLYIGFGSAVDGRLDKIVANLSVVKPTFMCGAPRIFEKVRAAVMLKNPSKGLAGRIARWAFSVGLKSVPYRLEGRKMPALLAAQHRIAHKLVFSKLHATMGGRIKFFISGSAKLSPQVQQWFYAAGLTVVEGYGLTETTAVAAVNHPDRPKFGTVGTITPGVDVKIAEDGEILLRGPIVMRGYHNSPEANAEAMVDGWFHTGDIGVLEADGHLRITDRKKDLIKTSGGKYVAPQKVESAVAANIPYIGQVVAVGEGHKYIGALITLDRDNLLKWGARHGFPDADYAELSQRAEIRASIEKFMAKANERLERWETVKKFVILDHELSVDEGGMTPNMKLRRKQIATKYAKEVASLFEDDETSI